MNEWDGPTKEVEEIARPVRWKMIGSSENCKLEQLWGIKTVTNGGGSYDRLVSTRYEWRAVPVVSE